MIRLSVVEDKEKLADLWNKVFGDTREAINLFFDYHYSGDNALVYEDNGKIVSMLYLLEGNLIISGKSHPSYYLYAAATDPQYRGRGIMGKMLEQAKNISVGRGMDYVCLLPAADSLYDFYKKFGYRTVFKNKIAQINIENSLNLPAEKYSIADEPIKQRRTFFEGYDYFDWDNKAIEYAILQHKFYGGMVNKTCEGYCLYNESNGEIVVKETTLHLENVFDKKSSVLISLPSDYKLNCIDYKIVDSGMALPLNDNAAESLKEIKNAYLGLTLD